MTDTRYSVRALRTEWEARDMFCFVFFLTEMISTNILHPDLGKMENCWFSEVLKRKEGPFINKKKPSLVSQRFPFFAVRLNWLWWKHPHGSHGHRHRTTHPDIRTDIKASAKLHTHWTTSSPLSPVQFCLEFFTSLWKVDHDLALSLELQGCIRSFIQLSLMRS